jgi:hypothetical protein
MCRSWLHLTRLLFALLLTSHAANAEVVFTNDFESNTTGFSDSGSLTNVPLARVSLPTDSGGPSSPNHSMWLGKLGDGIGKSGAADEIVTLPLSGLTPGHTYSVSFDLLIGASWDGAAGGYGPDSWRFAVNGTRLIDTIFSNVQAGVDAGAYSPQRYTDTQYTNPNGPDVPRFSGADASYYTIPGYADDYAIYHMGYGAGNPILNFQATASTATLEFARYGNTGDSADEYWALDNVRVTGTHTATSAATTGTTPIPGGTGTFATFGAKAAVSAGHVAFFGTGSGGQQGIYLHPDGPPIKIADLATAIPGGTGNFTGFGLGGIPTDPCVSGDNVVFFGTGLGGQQGVYRGVPDGPPIKVADLATAIPGGVGNFTGFSLNNIPTDPCISGDTVAFVGVGAAGQQGVYRAVPEGPPIKVADSATTVPASAGHFVLFSALALDPADATNLAMIAAGASVQGVYATTAGGPLTRVADTTMHLPNSNSTFASFNTVAIDSADVALLATGSGGEKAIFADLAGTLLEVIRVNDSISGLPITDLDFGPFGFSEASGTPQVTYRATFSDGRSSILTATITLPGIPGDYNNNGVVDAADYVAWRNNQGTANTLPNDPLGGTIGAAQYNNGAPTSANPPAAERIQVFRRELARFQNRRLPACSAHGSDCLFADRLNEHDDWSAFHSY